MANVKPAPSDSAFTPRGENLSFIFQEVLTATVRLRSERQAVADVATFRGQMREALRRADSEARARGYSAESVKQSIFATVAFLDESILNLQNQTFAEWVRKPLQEELFGVHVAGEIFFENLKKLLSQNDAPELADVLEVHLLCLQLGYRGRYGMGAGGDLRTIIETLREKIRRTRGEAKYLAPAWAPPPDAGPAPTDTTTRRLALVAIGCLLLVLVLFTGFKLSLISSASSLESAPEVRR
jgi:type VI secretion system protein ImpK